MLSESVRNWLMGLVIDALETGEMPKEELSDEEMKVFKDNYEYLKRIRDRVGPEAFDKITIDVGYDY